MNNCQCCACNVKIVHARSTSAKLAAKMKVDKEEQPEVVLKATPEKQKVVKC